MVVVCTVISAICFLLFVHPYLIYPLTLRAFRRRALDLDPGKAAPEATLLFSAYNEERALPAKIDNVLAIRGAHPRLEVIAFSDGSTDRTAGILLAEQEAITAVISESRVGKATGMGRMVRAAHGDICIFTDANVILAPEAVDRLLRYFADPAVGGVAGTLQYINDHASMTARVGGLYWRFEEWLKRAESRSGSIVSADGSIFACRRSLYPRVPAHLLDDMTVSVSLILAGTRLVHAIDVVAFEKNLTSASEELRRKRRIACRALNTHRHLWPMIRAQYKAQDLYKYVSHKLLRWFGFPFLLLAAGFGGAAALIAGQAPFVLGVGGIGIVMFALGLAGVPLLSALAEPLLMLAATFLGVVDALRGRTYQTWTPAASRN